MKDFASAHYRILILSDTPGQRNEASKDISFDMFGIMTL